MSRISFFCCFIILLSCTSGDGQINKVTPGENSGIIGFYNVENLFDTLDDPEKYDEDFTPTSDKKWTEERYQKKLSKLASVIDMKGIGLPIFFGLCEVENSDVLEDLVNSTPINGRMNFAHQEGADGRGIDVALIYDKIRFKVLMQRSIEVPMPEGERTTRDILYVKGNLEEDGPYHIFVNHWPSRNGGAAETEHKRLIAALILSREIDSILEEDKEAKIIVVGDFNDYPENKSIEAILEARSSGSGGKLINLMAGLAKTERGSYNYRGNWGFLDQIMISSSLQDDKYPEVIKSSVKPYFTEEMIYKGRGGDTPNKTYGGSKYYGGYSDHLPVICEIQY